jgi:hypothetical protein
MRRLPAVGTAPPLTGLRHVPLAAPIAPYTFSGCPWKVAAAETGTAQIVRWHRLGCEPESDMDLPRGQHPLRYFQRAMTGQLDPSLLSSNELIGNVVQVIADNLRLRTDP